MPENYDNLLVDWEGLARAFQGPDDLVKQFATPYPMRVGPEFENGPNKPTSKIVLDNNLELDASKLWNNFEFNEEKWNNYWDRRQHSVTVNRDKDGKGVFDFIANDVPDFIGQGLVDTFQFRINPGRAFMKKFWQKIASDPQAAIEYAKSVKKTLPDIMKRMGDPDFLEEVGMGVEEGVVQNVNLLVGSNAKSYDSAYMEALDAAMREGYAAKIISEDEMKQYEKFRQDKQVNTGLAFDISAGLTNSVLIMGELYATGGLAGGATLTGTGLKFFSTGALKVYGKALLKAGVGSWKLMGAGANIRALGDAIDTAKEENLDTGEFIVELMGNTVKENAQAFAEGASEVVLGGLKLGSVPLKKWLGAPVKEVFSEVGTAGQRLTKQYYTARELKDLIKSTTNPMVKTDYMKALNTLRQNRKDIVKMITKNTGKKMVDGILLETSTEQLTDLLQDAFEKNSHASALNLLSGDPEARSQAFKNLVVEASVGLGLGFGLGVGEIWSRKPLQELREKFGDQVADQVVTTFRDPALQQAAAKVLVDNGKITNNPDVAGAQGTAKVMLDLGTKEAPQTNDEIEGKATQQARFNLPTDIADVVSTVEKMQAPNILDFAMQVGQKQLKQTDKNIGAHFPDINILTSSNNFLADASPEVLHGITDHAYNNVLNEAINRGIMDQITFIKDGDIELKRDVAVGIALNFDKLGWGYVRHKYATHSNIDFVLEEAEKVSQADIMIEPSNPMAQRLYHKAPLKEIQKITDLVFKKSVDEAKAVALGEAASVITAEVDYIPTDTTGSLAESANEPIADIDGGFVEYTGDLEGMGEGIEPIDPTKFADVERPFLKAVAVRLPEGNVVEGDIGMQHMDLTYGSRAKADLRAAYKGEYGYVDWNGKFYSRDDMRSRFGEGESITLMKAGVLAKLGTRFEGNIPDVTFRLPTYDSVLPQVEESTFYELAKLLESKGLHNEITKEVMDKIMPVIGNRKVFLSDMGPNHSGSTDPVTLESRINTKAPMFKSTAPYDTLVHEAMHSWLMIFMDSQSDLSKKFKGQIRGVMNTVKSVLNSSENSELLRNRWTGNIAELQQYKVAMNTMIRKAFLNEEEFLTSVFSDTQAIKWLTDRVLISGPTRKLTGWKKVWNSIAGVLKKEAAVPHTATQKLKESLEDFNKIIVGLNMGLNKKFNIALARENKRLAQSVTSSHQEFEGDDDSIEDDLDEFQVLDDIPNEDESRVENQTVNNFVAFMAKAQGVTEAAYREHVRQLKPEIFEDNIAKFDEKNNNILTRKLQRIYNGYKHIWPTFEEFKSQFVKRQYINILNKTAKVSAIVMATNNVVEGEVLKGYEVRLVQGSYVDGKGAKRNTFRETIALESFVPEFEKALGLDPGTFQVVFLDGFESVRDGQVVRRQSFDRLRNEFFHDFKKSQPLTGHLADWLWDNALNTGSPYAYLYLGNFAKKNTLPVLAFEAANKTKIREALEKYEVLYANAAVETFGSIFKSEAKESQRMAATARALLETIWFGYDLKDPSIATKDWNKIMKRATKWLVKKTHTILKPSEIADKFGNRDLSGIKLVGNDAEIRTAVLNSKDTGMVDVDIMGIKVSIPLNELLLNEFGTPIGDGSSIYIIGQFDELYLTANGALKSGIIKNVYGSLPGEPAAFIKHAMHGVHRDSILGRWMIQNNLGMITFDESLKEGKEHYTPIGAAEFQNKDAWAETERLAKSKGQELVMTLKLSRFQRIKEIENQDTLGGSTKQLINGTAFSELYNKALLEAAKRAGVDMSLNELLIAFSNANTQETVKWFSRNSSRLALLDLLRNVIAEPKSPLEESVSNIWGDLLTPKEGQTDEDLINKYGEAFDHAHTAECLRNRLQHRMAQLLGGKTAGMRTGITPNFGYMNHKRDVEPITQHYNLADILISDIETVPAEVLKEALPESGLLGLVRKLQEVSRAESRAHTDLHGHELKRRLDSLQAYRIKLIKQVRALDSSRLNSIVTEGSTKVSPHRLINWSHSKVQNWMHEVVFGKRKEENGVTTYDDSGILNIKNGRLRRQWKLVPEDFANKFGVKPGDWVMSIITPTDSPLGMTAFRVAAITKVTDDGKGRKVSDRNATVLNSEWSQSFNGKDHDADDEAEVPFHPTFWRLDHYKAMAKIAAMIPEVYTDMIRKETVRLLNEKNTVIKTETGEVIGPEDLSDPVRGEKLLFGETGKLIKEKYTVLINGAPSQLPPRVFPIMGQSFIQLDSMYLFSPAPIINERLYHTATSAVNMRAKKVPIVLITNDGQLTTKGSIDGKPMEFALDFEVRNPNWMRTNINHQAATHANVDFPNNTALLAFNSDPMVWASQFWGLHDDKVAKRLGELLRPIYQSIRDFQKLLFEDSFNLARRRDTELFEKLGYFETMQQLQRAKSRLYMLATGDKQGMKNLYRKHYADKVAAVEARYKPGTVEYERGMLDAKRQLRFIDGFIDNMEVDNVYQYPLFNTIRNLSPEAIPDIGNTYKDHLINQVIATGETLAMHPELMTHRANAIKRLPMSFLIVGESAADKVARQIMRALGKPGSSSSRAAVVALQRSPERLQTTLAKVRPSVAAKVKKLLEEFAELNSKIGQQYKSFTRGTETHHVDGESIVFSRIPREMDYAYGRAAKGSTVKVKTETGEIVTRPETLDEYWNNQLRMVREEAVTIIHAFDVEPETQKSQGKLESGKLSETAEERRTAHQRVYPMLWKQILQSPFLFFSTHSEAIELHHPDGKAILKSDGRGQLEIIYAGQTYKHTELKSTDHIYKLLTERNGYWEGISDTSTGTVNRANMRKLIRMARNLSMDTRFELAQNFIADKLYGENSSFTSVDQVAFWISLISQTSHQATQDNKAKGFIVNQSAYDKNRPYKYQNNHLALNLMATFEESLTDGWLQWYAQANKHKERMRFEDQPAYTAQEAIRHYFSSYRDQLETVSKDISFVDFYKRMRSQDWKQGLDELRRLVKSVVVLRALSENGIYYEDLVKDLHRLSNTEFFNKYKGVSTENINLSIEKYMGRNTIDQWIRQHAGEDSVEFRTRGTIIALYWALNGARILEKKGEAKLGKIGKYLASFIGYDMVSLRGEKKSYALRAKDEEITFFLDADKGQVPATVSDIQIATKPFATRTWLPFGESTVAQTKSKHANRTLNAFQVNMNDEVRLFEDVVSLTSDPGYRSEFKGLHSHRKKIGQKADEVTPRAALISQLLDQIPEGESKQKEVARKEIFELAENLRSRGKIWLEVVGGRVTYNIQLNKIYRYANLDDLMRNHLSKASAMQRLQLIGALDIRYMYDIMVPKYLDSVITYLTESRDVLNAATSFTQALNVEATLRKYLDIRDSLMKRQGNYMPHMFPESEFRLLWLEGFMKHEIDRIIYDIAEAKKTGKDPVLAGMDPEKDIQRIHDMAFARADDEYNKISHDWHRGSIIPNFLPRQFEFAEGYSKTDPTIHFNYITKLIEGLKKDVLKADWYIYQQKAREAGERTSVMELTRQWYAKQVNEEELNSQAIKTDDVKPGMQVNFNQRTFLIRNNDPSLTVGTGVVSGVVRKVTADEVILDLDVDRIRWEIKQDLRRWTDLSDKLHLVAKTSKASNRQHIVLQNLLLKGYLTNEDFTGMDLSQLSMLDAANLAVKGLRRAIKEPEKMARFKWNEIWTQDARGERIDGYIRRYARSGALEFMRTRERELHNLQIMAGRYDGAVPIATYRMYQAGVKGLDIWRKSMKRVTSLLYMGMASAFKARVVNQFGATINNLIDAPYYNSKMWSRGNKIWDRIKHGKIELMDPDDAKLYKVLVSLGLTEDNSLLAIALEAANIKPEDMLIQDAKPEAIRWLTQVWQDAVGYKEVAEKFKKAKEEILKTADPKKKNKLTMELQAEKAIWQAKVEGILNSKNPTDAERKAAWLKVEELAQKGKLAKLNVAQEQGIDLAMATRLVGNVTWKSFYTSNLGVGFQAKAERLRIPAFFIGYLTAIDMGYTEEEAVQFGVNSIELRHAFYGSASKQFGANTEMGTLLFQYAQYQYNALSKAIRVMHEAIPQMLRFAHNRPEEVSRIKHLGNMFRLIQTSVDAKGNALKRGEVTLKEINLAHGIMMKVLYTGIMMQLGTRIFYGITNFQDPVGQAVYKMIDYIITLLQSGFDPGDDDDRERLAQAIQDGAMVTGLLYKYSLQTLDAVTRSEEDGLGKTMADTFIRGRAEDSFNFVWRTSNTAHQIAYELGAIDEPLERKEKTYFDTPWLTDQLFTGIKIMGWTPADNEPGSYEKRGFFGTRTMDAYTSGRYVETEGQGISGFGEGGSKTRFAYLFDPQSYIPFLDRMVTGK